MTKGRWCVRDAVLAAIGLASLLIGQAEARNVAAPNWERARDTTFRVLAADASLPESSMPLSIAQDRSGFIWIATEAGVGKWDGRGFRTFGADGRPGSLPERSAKVVATDGAGRLWVGLSSEGLVRFDPETETFRRPANATRLDRERVFAIARSRGEDLWVASDSGVTRVSGRTLRVDYGIGRMLGLPVGAASSIAEDRRGLLSVVVAGRLYRQAAIGGRLQLVDLVRPGVGEASPSATTLLVDRNDQIWVSTTSAGIILLDRNGAVSRRIQLRSAIAGSSQPMAATAIEVRPGVVWIDTHEGIYEIDSRIWTVRRMHHDADRGGSLADDAVNALMIDRSGLVWIAAASTLSIADPRLTAAATVGAALGHGKGTRPYRAWSVGAAPDGRLWLGSEDDPLRILDLAGRAVPAYVAGEATRPRGVTSLAFTTDGQVYAASEAGLFKLNLDGRVLNKISDAPARGLALAGHDLYVGGTDGLSKLDTRAPRARLTRVVAGSGLTSPRVTALLATADGVLWIGTSHGLNRLDMATGGIMRFVPDASDPGALGANYVNDLHIDGTGRLWVATSGGGIAILARDADGKSRFRHLTRRDGLPNETVDAMLAGRDGAVWASTDAGVARIDPRSLAIDILREAEGVQSLAHWQAGRAVTSDGRLVFAGTGGLTVIDTAARPALAHAFPLVVTEIRVGSNAVPPASAGRAGRIEVSPSAGGFAVEFSFLDFAAADRIRYSYRLSGLETNWTQADPAHRTARYTSLPPGDYILQLRASGRDGTRAGGQLDIPVHVVAAWNQTLGFKGAVAALILFACWGFVQLRIHFVRRRERLLEAVVEERTAALEHSQIELQKLAYFDALTGLANRRMFTRNVERLLTSTERQAPAFALILVDLDRFKIVNDTMGHDAGDALLVEAAGRLVASVRENDSVARLGGDEFAILLSGHIDTRSLEVLCGRVIGAVAAPILFAGSTIETSASLGVALFPDNGQTQDELYKAADLALYAAKRGGRSTWRMFSDLVEGTLPRSSAALPTAQDR